MGFQALLFPRLEQAPAKALTGGWTEDSTINMINTGQIQNPMSSLAKEERFNLLLNFNERWNVNKQIIYRKSSQLFATPAGPFAELGGRQRAGTSAEGGLNFGGKGD